MSREDQYRFRLYVAGEAENSALALANLKAVCKTLLPGRCRIEIVDVFKDPDRALADRIFMTPTLVKIHPNPSCRIVGTLGDEEKLLNSLGLSVLPA